MKKVSKFIALLLAALMLMTSFAFAATGSKEEPSTGKKTGRTNEYQGYSTGNCTLIGVKKNAQKLKTKRVPKNPKLNGYKFTVTAVAKNAFAKMKKLKTIKFFSTKALKVAKGAFGKLNTKKMTIKVTKKMSKSEFKKFKKNLRKAGFKGTIKRVAL
jgi:hypothetical protein